MTLIQTLSNIKSDHLRMSRFMGIKLFPAGFLFIACMPAIVALTLYRFSHYFYVKRLRFIAWPLWLVNQYLTGADISPRAEIGRSCYIGHPVGTVICGKIGENAIFFGCAQIGGGMGRGDVGAGDGLPVIGNDVVIGVRATILGPIRIGSNVSIGAGTLVVRDVENGFSVVSRPPMIIKTHGIDYNEIAGLK